MPGLDRPTSVYVPKNIAMAIRRMIFQINSIKGNILMYITTNNVPIKRKAGIRIKSG
jgi:hypothetical protein